MRTVALTTINRQQNASQRKLHAACVRKHAKKVKVQSHHWARSDYKKLLYHVYYNTNRCVPITPKFVLVLTKFGKPGKHLTQKFDSYK